MVVRKVIFYQRLAAADDPVASRTRVVHVSGIAANHEIAAAILDVDTITFGAEDGYIEDGIVLEEFQKGYKLNGRVIRPSKVIVNNIDESQHEDEKESE